MRLVGLISAHEEGELLRSAEASLIAAVGGPQFVYVLDGAIGPGCEWATDAEKRTSLLQAAKRRAGEVWCVVLDGDEVILWPEYLRDFVSRARASGQTSLPLRIVELDGSVVLNGARVFRADQYAAYVLSSNVLRTTSGVVVTLPHERVCEANGWPVAWRQIDLDDGGSALRPEPRCRPPLQGEPHILHRSALRDPARAVERQHLPELRQYDAWEQRLGISRRG